MSRYRKPTGARYGTHPVTLVLAAPTLTQNATTKAYVAIPARAYVNRAYLLNPGASATTAGAASFNVLKYVDDGAGDVALATINPEAVAVKTPTAFAFDQAKSEGDRSVPAGGMVVLTAVADNNAVANIAGMQVVLELLVLE
jgi:hypothetical protein